MVVAQPSPSFDDLVDTLWLERRALERLLCTLTVANLMLAQSAVDHVPAAAAEVEQAIEALHAAERACDAATEVAAGTCDIAPQDMTLSYLIDSGPGHLRADFHEHRAAILELVGEIETITRTNRRLTAVGLDSIRAALGVAAPLTYDAAGHRSSSEGLASRVVRVL